MTVGEYTFCCLRGRPTAEWTRVMAHPSDEAAIEEARLLLQSQAALPGAGPLAVRVGRGRDETVLEWLGLWRLQGSPRWEPH